MDTRGATKFLAFMTFSPSGRLDAAWLLDALDAASRRLSLPEVVGLEDRVGLFALDAHDQASVDALDRAVFMIVLLTGRDAPSPYVNARIERFLARPTQTSARDYLIPVLIPADNQTPADEANLGTELSARVGALSYHWTPTLTRHAGDEAGSAWARVTEQTVALMARVLTSAVGPPADAEARWVARSDRIANPTRALASARSMLTEIEREQADLSGQRARLERASEGLIAQCIDAASAGLTRWRFDAEEVQRELTQASDAYHEALESIVEETALRTLSIERRAEGCRRHPADAETFVPPLDPVLSELYDKISPGPPSSDPDQAKTDGTAALKTASRGRGEPRLGALLGLPLGPLGALVGGLVGAARAHRRKKETLTAMVREQAEAIVDRARSVVDAALDSVESELRILRSEWLARIDVLSSLDVSPRDDGRMDIVECSVFAPKSAQRGRSVFVLVFFDGPEVSDRAPQTDRDEAGEAEPRTLAIGVARRQKLAVHLDFPPGMVAQPVKELTWCGQRDAIGFVVHVGEDTGLDDIDGVARIFTDGVPVGEIAILMKVADRVEGRRLDAMRLVGASARHFEYAFISFADDDFEEAADRALALEKSRVPFVRGRLAPGTVEHWRDSMMRSIDRCDLFLLCWSESAARSKLVEEEWRRALDRQRRSDARLPAFVPITPRGAASPVAPPSTRS